jgi:hypothetical protein
MPAILSYLASIGIAFITWFSAISSGIIAMITLEGVKFLAWRGFYIFVLGAVIPILSYNVFCFILSKVFEVSMQIMATQTGSATANLALSFTGLAGWVASQANIPQVIAVYMTAISIRFMLSLIPFIGK